MRFPLLAFRGPALPLLFAVGAMAARGSAAERAPTRGPGEAARIRARSHAEGVGAATPPAPPVERVGPAAALPADAPPGAYRAAADGEFEHEPFYVVPRMDKELWPEGTAKTGLLTTDSGSFTGQVVKLKSNGRIFVSSLRGMGLEKAPPLGPRRRPCRPCAFQEPRTVGGPASSSGEGPTAGTASCSRPAWCC